MDIPNTVFVALGAIVAALLTGIFSFVSLINQKEGKISEFRLAWINGLRDDISKLLSCIEEMSSEWQLISVEESEKNTPFSGKEWLSKFRDRTKGDTIRFYETYQRILMRLNTIEHSDLVDELRQARNYISEKDVLVNKKILRANTDRILEKSQVILKREWEVVKAGEKSYRRAKNIAISLICILMLALVSFFYPGLSK